MIKPTHTLLLAMLISAIVSQLALGAQEDTIGGIGGTGAQEDITWQSFTAHGPLAFLPLVDSETEHFASLVWYDHPDRIAELKELNDEELLLTLQQTYPKRLPKLNQVVERANFPLFKSHAIDYVKQGVALAGDAAHAINPLAGQGVNLGFLDAAVLIEEVAQAALKGEDIAALALLRKYQKRRRAENQKRN